MSIIRGGISFRRRREIPQKMKDWIHANGLKVPFNIENFIYRNTNVDIWLRVKNDGNRYMYDMANTEGNRKVGRDGDVPETPVDIN